MLYSRDVNPFRIQHFYLVIFLTNVDVHIPIIIIPISISILESIIPLSPQGSKFPYPTVENVTKLKCMQYIILLTRSYIEKLSITVKMLITPLGVSIPVIIYNRAKTNITINDIIKLL